jgi:hypothetical protein
MWKRGPDWEKEKKEKKWKLIVLVKNNTSFSIIFSRGCGGGRPVVKYNPVSVIYNQPELEYKVVG